MSKTSADTCTCGTAESTQCPEHGPQGDNTPWGSADTHEYNEHCPCVNCEETHAYLVAKKLAAPKPNPSRFDVIDDRGTVWGRGLPFIDALALSKNLTPKRGKAPQFKLVPSSDSAVKP